MLKNTAVNNVHQKNRFNLLTAEKMLPLLNIKLKNESLVVKVSEI